MLLAAGDFVLIPSAFDFTASSVEPPSDPGDTAPVVLPDGEIRHGDPGGPPDVRTLVGYCAFASPDAGLLVSLLPQLVHVRGEPRLATLVELVREESRAQRPARDVILERLLEVLLIEALRSTAGTTASPGLLRGLGDERVAAAIRRMHEHPTRAWIGAGCSVTLLPFGRLTQHIVLRETECWSSRVHHVGVRSGASWPGYRPRGWFVRREGTAAGL